MKNVLDGFFKKLKTVYYIHGKETAPSSSTPHLQWYFRTKDKVYRATIQSYNITIWIDLAKGNEKECIDNRSKSGDFVELELKETSILIDGFSLGTTMTRRKIGKKY